jgi:hypothetical protein
MLGKRPISDSPLVASLHAILSAPSIEFGSAELGSPTLELAAISMLANALSTAQPAIGQPTLHQHHFLDADNLECGALEMSGTAVGEVMRRFLYADDIVTGSPDIGRPFLDTAFSLNLVWAPTPTHLPAEDQAEMMQSALNRLVTMVNRQYHGDVNLFEQAGISYVADTALPAYLAVYDVGDLAYVVFRRSDDTKAKYILVEGITSLQQTANLLAGQSR